MKRVLTYGTFDILHEGHIRLLQRAKALGDYLIVGISTDEFNDIKGKKSYYDYETRKQMVEALGIVDEVIPETHWEQKPDDIRKHNVDILVMGDDWATSEKFLSLKKYCEVLFLPRTPEISTTDIKEVIGFKNGKSEIKCSEEEINSLTTIEGLKNNKVKKIKKND